MVVTRRRVTMRVTVSVPVGVTAARARQEVRAKLQGYDGHQTWYSAPCRSGVREIRDLDDDGGVKVIAVQPQ